MSHTGNPSTQEAEAGGSGVQSHFQLQREYRASLSYARPCLKYKKKKTQNTQKRNHFTCGKIHITRPAVVVGLIWGVVSLFYGGHVNTLTDRKALRGPPVALINPPEGRFQDSASQAPLFTTRGHWSSTTVVSVSGLIGSVPVASLKASALYNNLQLPIGSEVHATPFLTLTEQRPP